MGKGKTFFIISIVFLGLLSLVLTIMLISNDEELKRTERILGETQSNLNYNKNLLVDFYYFYTGQNISESINLYGTETYFNYLKEEIISDKEITNSRISNLEVNLEQTQHKLDLTQPFLDRVNQGTSLTQAYKLLSDYDDETTKLSSEIGKTGNLWTDAKKVYSWINNNYGYCGDRGLEVSGNMYHFQFFSPDELLLERDNHNCGDCDDHAFLFAGILYSMGYNDNEVGVICGKADGGGHCWNSISYTGSLYRVDSVCGNVTIAKEFLGIPYSYEEVEIFPDTPQNVDCFENYVEDTFLTYNEYGSL